MAPIPRRSTRPHRLALLLGASLVAASGCAPHPAAHAPAAEVPALQHTVWESGYELFVEHPVPVAGEPFVLVTHVSDTRTGEPRRAGPVTFRSEPRGGTALAHVEPEPAREGIYLPRLVLPSAGTWTVRVEIPGPDAPAVVTLPAVEVRATRDEALAADAPPEPEGLAFLKEQQWRLGTRVEPLELRALTRRVRAPAVVRAAPERQARVTPPVAGRLELVESRGWPRLGQDLAAGELLAYVRPPLSDYVVRLSESQAERVRARVDLERAEQVLARTERLHAEGARTERELEAAQYGVRSAQAALQSAEGVAAALGATGAVLAPDASGSATPRFELRAPLAGTVRAVAAVPGEFVEVDRTLVELRDSSVVHVEAQLRPELLDQLVDREQALFVRLRGMQGDEQVLPLDGARLLMLSDSLEPHSLTVPVLYEVPNPDGRLRVGELIEVHLALGAPQTVPALPLSALVEEQGEPTVYVQLAGETFEKRHPVLGFRDGASVQVLAGLEPGERVVTHGAYAIRLAAAAGSVPAHGHEH